MTRATHRRARVVPAVHGRQAVAPDPPADIELADAAAARPLARRAARRSRRGTRAATIEEDARMRRAVWRALARRFGHGVRDRARRAGEASRDLRDRRRRVHRRAGVHPGPLRRPLRHRRPRLDRAAELLRRARSRDRGVRRLGSGRQGARLASTRACRSDVPIIQTDLEIEPVRIGAWADIGVNAVILPGVTVGKGAIVGAGAVVTNDVAGVRDRRRRAGALPQVARRRATGDARGHSMTLDGATIVVTGGAGLIGSTTIDLLLGAPFTRAHRRLRQPVERDTGQPRACAARPARRAGRG